MNILEDNGSNHGAIACNICFKYISKNEIEFKDDYEHICDDCEDKINLDDKYHNETIKLLQ